MLSGNKHDPLQGINLDHLLSGTSPVCIMSFAVLGSVPPANLLVGNPPDFPGTTPGDLVRSWSVCMWVGESMRGWVHVNTCGALGVLVQPALSEDCHVKMS